MEGEDEGLKLEEQVLVTSSGVEILSQAPHDAYLAGELRSDPLEFHCGKQ